MEKFDVWWEVFSNTPDYKNGNYTREDLALEAFDAGMEAKTAETLRDRFAMVALPALMAEFFVKGMSLHDVGAAAYDIAGSMLEARDIRRKFGTYSD